MKQKLSQEQIDINKQIEELRKEKEETKTYILAYQNHIIELDMMIRELRQKFPSLYPVEEKPLKVKHSKHVETEEEKIARLTKELEEIRSRIK